MCQNFTERAPMVIAIKPTGMNAEIFRHVAIKTNVAEAIMIAGVEIPEKDRTTSAAPARTSLA
jgi:hypothetical protein